MEELTLAILSDLHAYDTLDPTAQPPPCLCTTKPETDVNQHPMSGLTKLITDDPKIRADVLVCCGDLCDKARPGGILYTWDKLHKLQQALGAAQLITTPGNHDVDSRFGYTEFDARGFLQTLVPPFPFPEDSLNDRFWSRHYIILTEQSYRIIVLNTSAYHGAKEGEFEHGRVALRTLTAIRSELEKLESESPKLLNIVVCHHHPHDHGDIEDNDPSL